MAYQESPDGTNVTIVLTADTAGLQKFILKHAKNTNAFQPYLQMKRQAGEEQNSSR
jgi:hypothetical protein